MERRYQRKADRRQDDRNRKSPPRLAQTVEAASIGALAPPNHLIDASLGATLQQLRRSRGLNQTELGCSLGVSLQQVQKYESGKDRMAASTAFRAAEILGVDVSALYAGLRKASAGSRGSSKVKKGSPVLVVPLTVGARAAPARETELIDLIRTYQAIENASLRTSVRQIVRRLSSDPRQAKAGSR